MLYLGTTQIVCFINFKDKLEEKDMPHITTFMYSEGHFQENTPNGPKPHVVAPLLVLTPFFIPGTLSFSVTLGILEVDIERENKLNLKFINPVGEIIIDTGELKLPIINDPNIFSLPQDMRGMTLCVGFQNAVFRTEGTYKTQVFFNEELLGEFPIKVRGKEKLQ